MKTWLNKQNNQMNANKQALAPIEGIYYRKRTDRFVIW